MGCGKQGWVLADMGTAGTCEQSTCLALLSAHPSSARYGPFSRWEKGLAVITLQTYPHPRVHRRVTMISMRRFAALERGAAFMTP